MPFTKPLTQTSICVYVENNNMTELVMVDAVHPKQRLLSVDHYSQATMDFLENDYLNHLENDTC